ncbi:MAG: oligosaccharide flippase family protein [Pirellulales bacterium]
MNVSTRVAWNAITHWLANLVGGAIGLAIIPFLVWQLGKDGYGLVALLGSVVAFCMTSDLGLRRALTRHLSEEIANRKTDRVNEYFSSAMVFYALMAAVLAIGCFVGASSVVRLFKVHPDYVPQAVFMVRYYVSAMIFMWMVGPAYAAVLEGNHRFDATNYIHIVEVIVRAAGIFLVVGLTDTGLYGWAGAMIAGKVLSLAGHAWWAHRVWPTLKLRWRYVRADAFRELFSLGGYLFVHDNVRSLSVSTDGMVISSFLEPARVALYDPALQVVTMVQMVLQGLTRQLLPMATSYHATREHERLANLMIRGTRYTMLTGIPAFVLFGCFAEPIIQIWLPELGAEGSATAWVLVLWSIAGLLECAGGADWMIMMGINRVRFIVAFRFVLAVANLLASIGLVYLMSNSGWGIYSITGVVIPTVVTRVLERIVLTPYVARATGIGTWRYLREAYAGSCVVLAFLTAAAAGMQIAFDPQSLVWLAACAAVPVGLWFPLCWWVAFDDRDRDHFRSLFRRTMTRFGLGPEGV